MASQGKNVSESKSLDSTEFVKVKSRSRKRKQTNASQDKNSPMDVSEPSIKRPNLPPISGENLAVSMKMKTNANRVVAAQQAGY